MDLLLEVLAPVGREPSVLRKLYRLYPLKAKPTLRRLLTNLIALFVSRSQATRAPSLAALVRVGVRQHTQPSTKPTTRVPAEEPHQEFDSRGVLRQSVDRDFRAHGPLAVRLT